LRDVNGNAADCRVDRAELRVADDVV
jgi:hypothetical protein